ncbi:MAG: D-amino acid aminotransferase [SAR116 cluster bacterium MED-G05]|nr:MAG: D-amino acid aminotransferase [SAR116 cluster bacterium MED-G05]
MERTVFLNGDFMPESEARIPIFDRGLLFADSVYEGFGILDSQITDFEYHMNRLDRSLGELNMPSPMTRDDLLSAMMKLIAANDAKEGFLYLQITRGNGDRSYLYDDSYTPNIFAFTQGEKFKADSNPDPVALATVPDIRWARRDIKTTNLLGQVMAKQAAHLAGAHEALMIAPDGDITEAGSSSFFFIKDRELFVRPVSNEILHGITRQTMLRVAEQFQLKIRETTYTLDEALRADEAFITAASIYVLPVGRIDDHIIGDGTTGPITAALRTAYLETARAEFPVVPEVETT